MTIWCGCQGLQRFVVPEVQSKGIYESDRKKVKFVFVCLPFDHFPRPKAKSINGSNPALDMMAKKLALHLQEACKAHPLRTPYKVRRPHPFHDHLSHLQW